MDALEEAPLSAVAVTPGLDPSVPPVTPEAEVLSAQSTSESSQLPLNGNTEGRSDASNPGAGGLSGELDFTSSLLAARGEREAGEPAVSLRNLNNILKVLFIKLVRRNCLLIARVHVVFCVRLRWWLGSELTQVG